MNAELLPTESEISPTEIKLRHVPLAAAVVAGAGGLATLLCAIAVGALLVEAAVALGIVVLVSGILLVLVPCIVTVRLVEPDKKGTLSPAHLCFKALLSEVIHTCMKKQHGREYDNIESVLCLACSVQARSP